MNIHILTVPNEEIAKRKGFTGADWFYSEDGDLQIRVAKLSCEKYELLLGLHECIEAILARHQGVTVEMVDEFDLKYAKEHDVDLNSGDEVDAPYRHQHAIATGIERILAEELGVAWKPYDAELEAIPNTLREAK